LIYSQNKNAYKSYTKEFPGRHFMTRRDVLALLAALGVSGLTEQSEAATSGHNHASKGPSAGPLLNADLHFCGIHLAKTNPKFQITTQHYCSPLGQDMHQCLLYDSPEKNAKLLGVEYIVSDAVYQKLPQTEKRYWHPHTYEVLSGGLIAPEMSAQDEMAFMKALITTWGKTWHTWPDPKSPVPMGEPLLMWSATGDGQIEADLISKRDRDFKVSAEKIRATRTKELGLEVVQIQQPKSMDEAGRQWTNDGEDKPRRLN
jgi:hypothetical protein